MEYYFSGVALIISIIALYRQIKRDRKDLEFQDYQREFEDYKERQRIQERRSDDLQNQINNRSELLPYFHINHSKSNLDLDNMIVEVFLTNVGRESATNIGLVPIRQGEYDISIYFDTEFVRNDSPTHAVNDYFSEYFTMPGDSISLKISDNSSHEKKLYFLNFKMANSVELTIRIVFYCFIFSFIK